MHGMKKFISTKSAEATHHAYKASQIIPSVNAMFHIQVRQASDLNGVFI
jgi:hypothetical protein